MIGARIIQGVYVALGPRARIHRDGDPVFAPAESAHTVPDRPAHKGGRTGKPRQEVDDDIEVYAAADEDEKAQRGSQQEIARPRERDAGTDPTKGGRGFHLRGEAVRFLGKEPREGTADEDGHEEATSVSDVQDQGRSEVADGVRRGETSRSLNHGDTETDGRRQPGPPLHALPGISDNRKSGGRGNPGVEAEELPAKIEGEQGAECVSGKSRPARQQERPHRAVMARGRVSEWRGPRLD